MKDNQMYALFERIVENKSVSGIQKETAQWVIDLYARYEEAEAKNEQLEDEARELKQYIEDNQVSDNQEHLRDYYNSVL